MLHILLLCDCCWLLGYITIVQVLDLFLHKRISWRLPSLLYFRCKLHVMFIFRHASTFAFVNPADEIGDRHLTTWEDGDRWLYPFFLSVLFCSCIMVLEAIGAYTLYKDCFHEPRACHDPKSPGKVKVTGRICALDIRCSHWIHTLPVTRRGGECHLVI